MISLVPLYLLLTVSARSAQAAAISRDQGPTATFYPSSGSGEGISVQGASQNGLDQYLKIPYAQPPLGDLRFARPEAKVYNSSSINGTSYGPACIQTTGDFGFGNIVGNYGISEDCLTLNVFTPPGAAGKDCVPVVVYIPGGGYFTGTPSTYNGTHMVHQGIENDQPIIYVSVSYRVGILGFPEGKDFKDAGAANLGLRDVIMALNWVKDNIWAFGGDPNKVTLMGQSAGAGVTSMLYLNESIDLFRSGIAMSGSPTLGSFVPSVALVEPNATQLFYQLSGCDSATQQNQSTLDCLRAQPVERIFEAQANTSLVYPQTSLFGPIVDGDLIPEYPANLSATGKFARMPLIISDTRDEGTLFLDYSVNTSQAFYQAVTGGSNDSATIAYADKIMELYPDDPSQGSPFGSGNDTFGRPPTYKRYAAFVGDEIFQAGRRAFSRDFVATGAPIWGYEYAQYAPESIGKQNGTEVINSIGAFHGIDVGTVLDLLAAPLTPDEEAFRDTLTQYFLNFITHTDPNVGASGSSSGPQWPQYGQDKNLLFMKLGNVTVIPDTFREEAIALQYASAGGTMRA